MVVIPHTMAVCLCRPQVSLSQASELVKGEVFLHFYQVGGKQAAHTFMIRGRGDDMTSARCFTSTFSGLKARLSLSHAVCAASVFFCPSYIPVPEASVTFRTQQKVEQVFMSGWAPGHLSWNFFFYLLLFIPLDPIYFFLSFFSAQRWGFVIGCVCVCVSVCTVPYEHEPSRARVLCQLPHKETPKWIGSLLITQQR